MTFIGCATRDDVTGDPFYGDGGDDGDDGDGGDGGDDGDGGDGGDDDDGDDCRKRHVWGIWRRVDLFGENCSKGKSS